MRTNVKEGLTAWYAFAWSIIAYSLSDYVRWMFQFISFQAGDRAIQQFVDWIEKPLFLIGVLVLVLLGIRYPPPEKGEEGYTPLMKLSSAYVLLEILKWLPQTFNHTFGWAEFPVAAMLLLGLLLFEKKFSKVADTFLFGSWRFAGVMFLMMCVDTWIRNL